MATLDLQPLLRDERIELRPLAEADFEPLHAAASDPLIWAQHPSPDRHRREVFAGYFQSGIESGGALVVIDAASRSLIGSSRYYDHEPEGRTVKIGYTFLARKYWGGAYNGSMKQLMLDHAFRVVATVCFEVGEANVRSQIAVERLGAEKIDRRPRINPDGPPAWNLIYRLTADGWARRGS